ncbi:MAG TPA: zf-TFIIB domain-containing protein, partial [Candidatus Nitrosotenuis sp.]|nr:zf-TFIIB domain-containing protein [Candidatus Nitrosotenuis sp.]
MKCPKDGGDLRLTEVLGVQIDTCPTCDGCWLDPGELAQMQRFGGREPLPLELIDLRRTRFVCPRCQAPLEEGSHPTMPALRLERCSGCGG